MKPYYEHAGITIYHGDCREVLPELEPVDLVLTDPPYGIGWDTNYSRFCSRGGDRSRSGGDKSRINGDDKPFDPAFLLHFKEVVLWGANHYASSLPPGSWFIWDKRNADGTAFLSHGEIGWYSSGYGVYIKSISGQRHRATSGGLHPTQKPVALMAWCIKKTKAPGLILDPFMGSGTTLVAAKELGRKAIGIEIEEKYCEIAARRLAQEILPLA